MKKRQITVYLLVAAFLSLTCSCNIVEAADWPNWRGPDYNGISTEKDWDPLMIKDGIKPLWRASIGIGFSTFAVSDGRVYAMGNTGSKDIDESKHEDTVYCFDAETGKEVL